MKGKQYLVLILSGLLGITLFVGYSSANENVDSINLKLPLNPVLSNLFENDMFIKGNSTKFNLDLKKAEIEKTFIEFNAKVSLLENSNSLYQIKGNGIIHNNGKTYPFSVEDTIKKYHLSNNENLYFGLLNGNINNQKGEDVLVLSLHYIPETKQQEIVITSGAMDSIDGVGAIPFGKEFLTKEMIDLIKTANEGGDNNEN